MNYYDVYISYIFYVRSFRSGNPANYYYSELNDEKLVFKKYFRVLLLYKIIFFLTIIDKNQFLLSFINK